MDESKMSTVKIKHIRRKTKRNRIKNEGIKRIIKEEQTDKIKGEAVELIWLHGKNETQQNHMENNKSGEPSKKQRGGPKKKIK